MYSKGGKPMNKPRAQDKRSVTGAGAPLNCSQCGGKDLIDTNVCLQTRGLVQFDMKCQTCGDVVATWVNGKWKVE